MKLAVACIFTALLFIGCLPSSTIIMNEKYKNQNLSDRSMLIMPFSEESITIMNKDDVADDFEGDRREPEEVIKDIVYKTLLENSKFSLTGIKIYDKEVKFNCFLFQKDSARYFSIKKSFDNDSITYKFYVPKKEFLTANNINADIVLVINKLTFGRNLTYNAPVFMPGNTISTPGGSFTTPGHMVGGGSSEFLAANFDFIIYDYSKNDVITYGSTGVSTNFIFAMTKSTWETTFYRIDRELFKKTPFQWAYDKGQ